MVTRRDYYEILGLSRGAAPEEIKKAYRKKALEFHPDRNPDPKAEETFKEASEAYEVLCDPDKRQIYDRFGHAGLEGRGYHGFEGVEDVFSAFGDVFEEFFGGFGGFGRSRAARRSQAARGGDVEAAVTVRLEDILRGVEKPVSVYREGACDACSGSGSVSGKKKQCASCHGTGHVSHSQGFFMIQTTCPRCRGAGEYLADPCADCRGQGRVRKKKDLTVKVPAGIQEGTHLVLRGEGHSGLNGGPGGDLYIRVRVEAHPLFTREGEEIHYTLPVSMTDAALGRKCRVPTLEGEEEIGLPEGTDSGETVRLKKKGLPHLRSGKRGDQVVHVQVKTPKKLSRHQRQLMEEFEKD